MTREEASKILQGLKMLSETERCEIALDMAISALSVPERAKGKWVTNSIILNSSNTDYFCSMCGHKLKMDYTMIKAYQEVGKLLFCEHCGADMRAESED